MPALRSLPARLRAQFEGARRRRAWLTIACLLLAVLVARAAAQAQAPRGALQRDTASRLATPETVATPPADSVPTETTGEPVYEFEAGAMPAEGGEYYPGGEFGEPMFGDELYYEGMPAHSGVGRYGCQPVMRYGFSWQRLYLRADYLLWWGKGFYAPPLATTSAIGTPADEAGVLGLSSTSILFPTETLADASQSGGRARIGYWFDPCDTMAVEGTYFAIGQASSGFSGDAAEFPILARPFVNVTPGEVGNDAMLIAYPGLYTGTLSIRGTSSLQGAEVIVRHAIARGCDWRMDWTLGWRYNRLDDNLLINADRVAMETTNESPLGSTLTGSDQFSTANYFNGVQLGIITEKRCARWWLETRATLALGNNRAIVTIDGESTATTPVAGAPSVTTTYDGGLLTQPTNIGQYYNDDFAIVPQVGVNLGFEVCCGLWATVGYNFMYWSRVSRPGEQIDTDVNLSQAENGILSGLARPSFTGLTTDYWAQGLNFGLAYRF